MTARVPYPAPPTDTARRLEWAHLPEGVRRSIEARCGAPVLGTESIEAGFTPGMATIVTCADGSQHFVKAASRRAQRAFADSYLVELGHLRVLPPHAPAPRLAWEDVDDEWVIFATEFVDAEPTARPWDPGTLDACLDALEGLARDCTPAPERMRLNSFADDTRDWAGAWVGLEPPSCPERLDEAVDLARTAATHLRGTTLVHGDLRPDNALVDGQRALFCDWNWPATGPVWLDSFILLTSAYGDGIDVDAVIAARPLLRDAPPEAVDSLLALMAGYFLRAGCGPVPPNSPHVRDHQYWTGTVCWLWLAERRGW